MIPPVLTRHLAALFFALSYLAWFDLVADGLQSRLGFDQSTIIACFLATPITVIGTIVLWLSTGPRVRWAAAWSQLLPTSYAIYHLVRYSGDYGYERLLSWVTLTITAAALLFSLLSAQQHRRAAA